MIMETRKYNLSDELKNIMDDAFDHAKENNLWEISLESVEHSLILRYTSGRGKAEVINKIFSNLPQEIKDKLVEVSQESLAEADRYSPHQENEIAGKIFEKDQIIVSDELSKVFDRITAARDVAKDIMPDSKAVTSEIGTDEFFHSLLFEKNDINKYMESIGITTTRVLIEKGASIGALKREPALDSLEKFMKERSELPKESKDDEDSSDDDAARFEKAGEKAAMSPRKADPNSTTPTLDQFGIDMTWNAGEGKYDPVIGRDKEISQIIEILSCRKKCNAMLLGEAGAGKTALVEGLAQKIAAGDVPRDLKNKRIVSVSTTDLTAGTQYRGQLEERVMNLCKELASAKNVILYLDEFHSATSENSTSIADMLKPSLSRGEITVISSTTLDEFKRYIEKDGALKRRFQKVMVTEPNSEETYKILKGIVKKYQEFHHVKYSDAAIRACVEYSERYMYDRKSPDRAIDLLDTSGALTKLSNPEKEGELDKLEKEREKIKESKIKALDEGNFEEGMRLRDLGFELDKKISETKKKLSTGKSSWPEVTIENVAAVISKISGVAVDKIIQPEMEKIRGMKDDLKRVVIGQDEAIDSVVKVLSKSFLGLRNENRPVASLLFTGPSGVGKTLIAEKIAETVYGDKKALIRIDGGEYAQSHSVTKLVGSTASFVGYGDKAVLDQVRDRGSVVVLVDEVEKMNQEIINTIFLNMMDTGMVKMANGVDVSFRNAIIVFTSNEGTKDLELKGSGIGFTEPGKAEKKKIDRSTVMKALEKKFRPEFRGRLTGITVFNSLGEPEMMKIFDLELNKFKDRLKKKGYSLKVGKKLKEKIVKDTDTRYGARDLTKGIGTMIEDKIVESMLNPDVDLTKKKISVDLTEGDEVSVNFE